MTSWLDPERVAEILVASAAGVARRGSGYRVTAGAVLTAEHIVRDAGPVRVRFNAGRPDREWVAEGAVVWSDTGSDVAVVAIDGCDSELVRPALFGRFDDQAAVVAYEAVGFPRFKLRDDQTRLLDDGNPVQYRDSCHLHGTIPVLSNMRSGTLEIRVHPPAEDPDPRRSPWAGMSGAAVWSNGRIVGVICEHHRAEGLGRLTAGRTDRWYDRLDQDRVAELGRLIGLPARASELTDVVPTPVVTHVRAIHESQLTGFAPDVLLGRETELAELTRFCGGEEPYQWWQGQPWAGKTALAAWFVLHPPAGVDVVSFFVTGGLIGQADSGAFDQAFQEQLAALAGEPLVPTVARDGRRELLLKAAAARVRERGRRLLLVVDGLDEDQSSGTTIASLLPKRLPDGVRVLVTSRPHPDVAAAVLPDDHPLRRVVVRDLVPSPHTRGIMFGARQELTARLAGEALDADIIGLIATSGGGLTATDLAELTQRRHFDIAARLRGVFGRSLRALPAKEDQPEPVYAFAHETLRVTADEHLAADIGHYRSRIDQWADRYRRDEWPADTPNYLLTPYSHLLASEANHDRLTGFSTDRARHDRMLDRTHSDQAALTEVAAAEKATLGLPAPDLSALIRLAVERQRLNSRNLFIPAKLPGIWVRLGRARRGEALARSMYRFDVDAALGTVAAALAETRDWDNAQRVARDISNDRQRAMSLATIATAWASTNPAAAKRLADEAERLTRERPAGYDMPNVLGTVAAALFTVDEPRAALIMDEAERLAREAASEPARHMAELAQALAAVAPERAARLVSDAETLAAPREGVRTDATWMAWRAVIVAMARLGHLDRAERAASAARPFISPGDVLAVWRAIAAARARAGQVDRALDIARGLADYVWKEKIEKRQVRDSRAHETANALCSVAEQLVDVDPARAEQLATEADRLVRDNRVETPDTTDLRVVVTTLVRLGRHDDAERVARAVPRLRGRCYLLVNLAEALMNVDPPRARRIANELEEVTFRVIDLPYDPDDIWNPVTNAMSALAEFGTIATVERIAQRCLASDSTRNNSIQSWAWSAIAIAHARARRWDEALRTASRIADIDFRERSHAWAGIAGELARAGRWDDAEKAAGNINDHAVHAHCLCAIAATIGATDPPRTRRLVTSAVNSVRGRVPHALVQVLNAAAGALIEIDTAAADMMAREAEQLAREPENGESGAHELPYLAAALIERELPRAVDGDRKSVRDRAHHMLAEAIVGGAWSGALPVMATLYPAEASALCDNLRPLFTK